MNKTHTYKSSIDKEHREPIPKRIRRLYIFFVILVIMFCFSMTGTFAATDPIATVNNLSTFIFGLIRAVGLILLGFGIVQIGLSLKSQDAVQRANGFLTLAGGVVIVFIKEILGIITGG